MSKHSLLGGCICKCKKTMILLSHIICSLHTFHFVSIWCIYNDDDDDYDVMQRFYSPTPRVYLYSVFLMYILNKKRVSPFSPYFYLSCQKQSLKSKLRFPIFKRAHTLKRLHNMKMIWTNKHDLSTICSKSDYQLFGNWIYKVRSYNVNKISFVSFYRF